MPNNRVIDRTTDAAFAQYQQHRIARWDAVAANPASHDQSGYYHNRVIELYRFFVPEGLRVIEIGSGSGDLLASLRPSRGLGIDFSPAMVTEASQRHPSLEFISADAHDLQLNEVFDIVILSDLVNDVWDVQAVLERVLPLCTPSTRVILNFYNKLWQWPLGLVRKLGLARPVELQNWLSVQDIKNLLHLSGFEVITKSSEILLPIRLGPLSVILNRVMVKFWPAQHAALAEFVAKINVRNRTTTGGSVRTRFGC